MNIRNKPNLGPAPTVCVVGAGLAGLRAGHVLTQEGYKVVVLEANPERVGGRCWSKTFPLDENHPYGQVFEMGGELIDSSHIDLKQLAQELGFKLDNVLNRELPGTERLLYTASKTYDPETDSVNTQMKRVTESEAIDRIKDLWRTGLKKDYDNAGYPITAIPKPGISTERARELDIQSLTYYLENLDKVKEDPALFDDIVQLLKTVYLLEWSGEPKDLSSLDFHVLFQTRGPGKFRFWGESNEAYHVRGGNSQLADKMEEIINSTFGLSTPHTGSEMLGVKRGYKALKVSRTSDDRYTIKVEVDGKIESYIFDQVIMCLPVLVYRNNPNFDWFCDLTEAGISSKKMQAIQEIGMGPIGKLNYSSKTRWWNNLDLNGEIVASTKYAGYWKNGEWINNDDNAEETQLQQVWEVTRGQPGSQGIQTHYYTGDYALSGKYGTDATGRVVDGKFDVESAGPYEKSKWTSVPNCQEGMNKLAKQLGELNPVFEQNFWDNVTVDENGVITSPYEVMNWTNNEFARGAFVYYKPGQYAQPNGFAGVEGLPEPRFSDESETTEMPRLKRNLKFAGSWTDYDWNGWMMGAVVSGTRAAQEVISDLKELGYTQSI